MGATHTRDFEMSLTIIHLPCITLKVALMYDEEHGHQLDPIDAYLIKERV